MHKTPNYMPVELGFVGSPLKSTFNYYATFVIENFNYFKMGIVLEEIKNREVNISTSRDT